MKNIIRALALVLALVVFALPCALATETTAYVLQLSDPKVSAMGQEIDLTGLTVQLSIADNMVFVDVLGGGETALSAMAQIGEKSAAFKLGGMTNAYGFTYEELLTAMGLDAALLDISYEDIMALIQNWELPGKLTAIIGDFYTGVNYSEPETRAFDVNGESVDFTYTAFTADATQTAIDFIAALQNDEYLGALFAGQELTSDDISLVISGGTGTAEGRAVIEGKVAVGMNGTSVALEIFCLVDESNGTVDYSFRLAPITEPGELVVDGRISGTDTEGYSLEGGIKFDDGEGVVTTGSYSAQFIDAEFAEDGYSRESFSLDVPGSISVTYTSYTSGEGMSFEYYWGVDAEVEGETVSEYIHVTDAGSTADAFMYDCALGVSSGEETIEASCGVLFTTASIDASAFAIDESSVVSVFDISDGQNETASNELGMIVMQALMKLENSVPGLEGLTQSLMGGSAEY